MSGEFVSAMSDKGDVLLESEQDMPTSLVEKDERPVMRLSRSGKVQTRVLSRSSVALGSTIAVLAVVTVVAMATMDYGSVALGKAFADAAGDVWTMFTAPWIDGHFTMADLLGGLLVSLAIATLSTLVGAVVSFLLALPAAMNLSNRPLSNVIKAVMSVCRAVPTILWVLVFTVAIGLGPEAAVAGLLVHSVSYLVKAYSESFEEVDPGVIEAVRSTGASWWQVVFSAVVPAKVNELLSWTFIRFEINFVNAVAVGAVAGAGGIGYELFLAGGFYYDVHELGLVVYFCLAVAIVLEVVATQLRKRNVVND